jgi:serine protease Do
MNSSKFRHLRLAPFALALLVCLPALGQSLSRNERARNDQTMGFRQNPRVIAAFDGVVAKPSRSVVRVRCDGKDVALGTIVARDGWILTKNSELTPGTLTVTLPNGRVLPAKVTGFEDHYDLAMLKVDATGLLPIEWGKNASTKVGELLASPGVGTEPVAIGVLSVAARPVRARDLMIPPPPANAGFLGVGLDEAEGGARVARVERNSAADKAGIRVNDVVTFIADTAIIDSESMVNTIRHHKPGDDVPIKVLRDGKEIDLRATLGKRPADLDRGLARREYQNHLGSALSERRSGFPQILQHDMVLRPDSCGGPVVDLDGKALGINIARAGRVESYAIPAEAIKPLIEELKTGNPKPKPQLASAPKKKTPPSTRPAPYPKARVAGAPQASSTSTNINPTTLARPTTMPTPK